MKTKQSTPRWHALAFSVLVGAFAAAPAFGVHNPPFPFELDGNATNDADPRDDWQNVLPLTGGGETFVVDQVPPLATERFFIGGGSKDDNDIPSWKHQSGSATNPDKNNITNAYAKAYSVDHDGNPATPNHTVIYFGADRFANDGDAALGFWFFKNDVGLSGNGFSGVHTDDDILVQVDYVQGGAQAEIQIFRWRGDGSGTHGSPKKVLQEIAFASANGTTVCTAGDTACATTNEFATPSYWPYIPKSGPANVFPPRSFFEGAVDITALIGEVCFSSFMAETRSSHSETAQLKDFALGDFNLCSVEVTKSCPNDPVIDPSGTFLTSTFEVDVLNDGSGSVFDVYIEEDINLPGGVTGASQCRITSPVQQVLAKDTPVLIHSGELGAGQTASATIECDHTAQPLFNQVTARAAASSGGASDIIDSYQMVEADTCSLQINPMIEVLKDCKSVKVVQVNGTLQPQVCNTITVKNNSLEQLINVDVTDVPNNGQSQNLLVGGSLAPKNQAGDSIVFDDVCYIATATDNGTEEPEEATFSDQALASGDGAISGVSDADDAVANCKLCPPPQSQE